MRKTTAWARLPNATHIDRILRSAKRRPQVWSVAFDRWVYDPDTAGDALGCAEDTAYSKARDIAWDAVYTAAWSIPDNKAAAAAWYATAALIAWDEAGEIIGMPPHEVQTLAGVGNMHAVLMTAACSI